MDKPMMVAVEVTSEKYRVLRHVPSNAGFDADGKGVWPADQFTHRLLNEGSIRIVEDAPAPDASPAVKEK